jgi:ribonuclease Z
MPKLIILGSSNAVPSADHENTHLLLMGKERIVLIDTASNPVVRLQEAGVRPADVTDLILTHFHPDHVAGVPLLLMDMWLLGRKSRLTVHGLGHTLERVQQLMVMYGWGDWPEFFPVDFHIVPLEEMTLVLDSAEMRIVAAPVQHFIPNIGLRAEFKQTGKILAYSCDTEPCPQVLQLAMGADVLLHEASGPLPGHSSAAQAGEIAQQAEVGALYLVHYPTGVEWQDGLVEEAGRNFRGPIALGEDLMTIDFE